MELNKRFFDSLMADKRLSLRGLAAKMGMNHSQLSLTFSGARKMQLGEAAQLSQIFSVPLHVIVENAGVAVRPVWGKRVGVIGSVLGDGTVELYDKTVTERAAAPDNVPDDAVAIQFRTAGTAMEWMDGAVLFCKRPRGESVFMGRLCLCQISKGPSALALVKRGYRDGTFNLAGPLFRESVSIDWASPIIMTRN